MPRIQVKFYDPDVAVDENGESWGWVFVKGSLDDIPPTWNLSSPAAHRMFFVHESDPIWGEILSPEEIEAVADRLICESLED